MSRKHAILLLCLCIGVPSFASDVQIVANNSVHASSVSTKELQNIFLQDSSSLQDGSHVVPVIEKAGAAHEAFLKEYLGKTSDSFDKYCRNLVFTGRGLMPKIMDGDAEVLAYVARTKGAIGYVSSGSHSGPEVKILQVR